MHRLLLTAHVALLGACSLTGVGDFDIPKCTDNAQCNILNEREGIGADACQVYQCRSDGVGCELSDRDFDGDGHLARSCAALVGDAAQLDCDDVEERAFPGNTEDCDGVDNDCNGIIDDELVLELAKSATLPALPGVEVAFGDVQAHQPNIALAQQQEGVGRVSLVESDSPETMPSELRFGYVSRQDAADTDIESAPGACPEVGGTLEGCVLDQLASTRVTGTDDAELGQIVAAINTNGCAHGQVRIGHVNDAAQVVLHGPEEHSNLYLGVDVDESVCTGSARSEGPGATGINIAGLLPQGAEVPQALVTWIGDSHKDHDCGDAAPVEALGVWLEHSVKARWVNGANDGIPEVLGSTRGGGRPAVVPLESDSGEAYLVAYGAESGGIALHFLPAFSEPSPYVPGATSPRSTPALVFGMSASVASGKPADFVSIAVGPEGDRELEIALVWLSGECEVPQDVMLTRARVDVERGTLLELATTLVAEKATEKAPSAAYAASGFVTADHGVDGGYLVAWTDNEGNVELARVLSATGEVVGAPATVAVGAESQPLLFRNGNARLAVYSQAGDVISGRAQCGDSD